MYKSNPVQHLEFDKWCKDHYKSDDEYFTVIQLRYPKDGVTYNFATTTSFDSDDAIVITNYILDNVENISEEDSRRLRESLRNINIKGYFINQYNDYFFIVNYVKIDELIKDETLLEKFKELPVDFAKLVISDYVEKYVYDFKEMTRMPVTGEELLKRIETIKLDNGRNRMGCSENWYNPYYAIGQTFSKEEILAFDKRDIENLVRLGDAIAEGLY